MKYIITMSAVICLLIACQNNTADKTGPEYTSKYICPMHCEGSGASEMGTCPVCKMDYVLNKESQS